LVTKIKSFSAAITCKNLRSVEPIYLVELDILESSFIICIYLSRVTMDISTPTISLNIEQYRHLQEIAQRQGTSLNETLHEVIGLGIDALQHRKQKRLDALNQLTQLRQDTAKNRGKYPSEMLENIREERMQQINPFNNIAL
jgi:hypothetical protein